MGKLRPLVINLCLLLAVSLILAGAAEAALRITTPNPPGYVTPELYGSVNLLYRPNSQTTWRGNLGQAHEFDTPIRTNSIVQFDREHAVGKPAGVYRVVVAGDSFVEALQVPFEKGFPHLLEAALNGDANMKAAGRSVEVIKLGSSGNGALKTYEAVQKHAWQYQPDLVLFFFTDSNDFNDDWFFYRRQTGLEANTHVNLRPPQTSYDKLRFYKKLLVFPGSHLNRWIAFQATQWKEKRRAEIESAENWKESLGVYALPGSPRFASEFKKWEEAFRLTGTGILKMKEEAAKRGARFAVVLIDRQQTYSQQAYSYLYRLLPDLEKEVDLDLPAKKLQALLRQQKIPFVDLNPVFQKQFSPRRKGHYAFDGHWNANGHRWTAETLAPFVKNQVLHGA